MKSILDRVTFGFDFIATRHECSATMIEDVEFTKSFIENCKKADKKDFGFDKFRRVSYSSTKSQKKIGVIQINIIYEISVAV